METSKLLSGPASLNKVLPYHTIPYHTMLHSLVVSDRTRDVGLVVYIYVQPDGQFVENWSEKEQWCLSDLTLNAKLPVYIIEVCDRSKAI